VPPLPLRAPIANVYGAATPRSKGRISMNAELPDRISNDPKSPYYNADLLERGIGIRFNGVEKRNVDEYCVSEGWIRVAVGNTRDRRGNPLTIKLKGQVEPYLEGDKESAE
jgi:hypothetical protein